MKFIKKIIGLILFLIVLATAILVVMAYLVDFNEYKPLISDQVEKATGRSLNIHGDINMSLWPWLGVQVAEAELSNAPGFDDQAFAKVSRFDLKLALLPLLKKQYRVDKVLLHGLQLSLQKNDQGFNNWDDLIAVKENETSSTTAANDKVSKSPVAALFIQGVEIKNGSLSWSDAQNNMQASLDDINVYTGEIESNKQIPVQVTAHAKLNEPETDIRLHLQAGIEIDTENEQLKVPSLDLAIRILTPKLAAQNTEVKLMSSLNASLKTQLVNISDLNINLHTKGYQLPGGEIILTANSSATIDLQQQTALINSLQVESTGLKLNISGKATEIGSVPRLEGKLILSEFDLTEIAKNYQIELPVTSDEQVLKKIKLQANYFSSTNAFELKDLQASVDDSLLEGSASIENFSAPLIKYDINLNNINLNRYMSEASDATVSTATKKESLGDEKIELPLTFLRNINLEGLFKAEHIDYQDYKLDKLYIKTTGKDGVLFANPVNVQVFDGRIAVAARLDIRDDLPRCSIKVKAQQLQMETATKPFLLHVFNEKDVSLQGALDLNASLTTKGDSIQTFVSALDGDVDFRANQAVMTNIDVEYFMRERAWVSLEKKIRSSSQALIVLLEKKNFPTTEKEFITDYHPRDKTAFNVMRAKASISHGVVNNYDFLMASDALNITGKGAIDLNKQAMNYVAEIDLHRTHNSLREELLDIPMTIHFSGPFASLKSKPEMNAWANNAWKLSKQQGEEKVKKVIQEKARDKLKDMLKQWNF